MLQTNKINGLNFQLPFYKPILYRAEHPIIVKIANLKPTLTNFSRLKMDDPKNWFSCKILSSQKLLFSVKSTNPNELFFPENVLFYLRPKTFWRQFPFQLNIFNKTQIYKCWTTNLRKLLSLSLITNAWFNSENVNSFKWHFQ